MFLEDPTALSHGEMTFHLFKFLSCRLSNGPGSIDTPPIPRRHTRPVPGLSVEFRPALESRRLLKKLPPGEYAFVIRSQGMDMMRGGATLFCFGVD